MTMDQHEAEINSDQTSGHPAPNFQDRMLAAADELTAANDLILLVEIASNHLDRNEMYAINAGCYAALDRLERAMALLRGSHEGGPQCAAA